MALAILAAALLLGEPAPTVILAGGRSLASLRQDAVVIVGGGKAAAVTATGRYRIAAADRLTGPAAYLVDRKGVLRRVARAPHPGARQLLDEWRAGSDAFQAACARCHGEDGRSRDYQGIQPLGGIGNRLDEGQIRERLHPVAIGAGVYLVRANVLPEATLAALVRYVAGL